MSIKEYVYITTDENVAVVKSAVAFNLTQESLCR